MCPEGSAGCECYGNGTCDGELECLAGTCRPSECVAGSLNCDCFEGVCLTGLVCADGVCKADDPNEGCESVADCDDNLCTQGDALCEGTCQAGVEVQCPPGSVCDAGSGSCACEPGTKGCGNACIPDTQCCGDADCGGDSSCVEGFCSCDGGLVCGGECIGGATCCPGETTKVGCNCGAQKTCSPMGTWSSCSGGNPNPECQAGESMACGNCGQRQCTNECTWSACQGGGVCSPGSVNCTGEGKLETCSNGCFWQQTGTC